MSVATCLAFTVKTLPKLVPDIDHVTLTRMISQITLVQRVKLDAFPDSPIYVSIDTSSIHPRLNSCLWSPTYIRPVQLYESAIGSVEIPTFHRYGYPTFFKPSLAEVFACINACVPDWSGVRFVSISLAPHSRTDDVIVAGHHVGRCRMWGEEASDVISESWPKLRSAAEYWMAAKD